MSSIGLDVFDPVYITKGSDKIGVTEEKPEPAPIEETTSPSSILESFTLPEGIEITDILSLFVND